MLFKTIALSVLAALALTTIHAEPQKSSDAESAKVVFEVSVDGAEKWEGALRNVENARNELGASTKIEVVAHGKGVGMLLAKTSVENAEMKAKLEKLHGEGVVFAACENTMKRMKLAKTDFVELATTVPSGVAEVVRKQVEGYAYIKSGG